MYGGPGWVPAIAQSWAAAGYLADEDLALVVDVSENYRPWLAHPGRLYEAMNTVDPRSGIKRGLMMIECVCGPQRAERVMPEVRPPEVSVEIRGTRASAA